MIIKQAGTYRLLENFTMRGPDSIGTSQKGTLLTVSQIDEQFNKVIGPAFPDWHHWDLPVEPYTKEMEEADSVRRSDEYFEGVREVDSQEELDEMLGMTEKPKVVCLCGSTRFYDAFQQANYDLTMKGVIVLSVGFFMHSPQTIHGQKLGCTEEQKIMLDELHKRKIDIADYVFVLNVDGYIGESTASEINYAKATKKPVEYLERGHE